MIFIFGLAISEIFPFNVNVIISQNILLMLREINTGMNGKSSRFSFFQCEINPFVNGIKEA